MLAKQQQQPRGVIDQNRIREVHYDTSLWWDADRGIALPPAKDYDNASGKLRILNKSGEVETTGHPFFTALGSNGRACVTCHQPSSAMSLSLDLVRDRWTATHGKDPLFAAVDGSNCPTLPQEKQESHSLLLERGLFRVALSWPPATVKPDFRIEVMRDPTGCNKDPALVSVYRRPRVTANLQYIALPSGDTLMADGRERTLQSQAASAALIHEQTAASPTRAQLQQIEEFLRQLFMSQEWDVLGGPLSEPGGPALLGADNLAKGVEAGSINVSFEPWRRSLSTANLAVRQRAFRESVLRGVDLFSKHCASCHGAGNNKAIDVGTTNLPTAKESPELPLFRITCDASAPPHPQLGRSFLTQDPGRALITGKCADAGSIVPQQLRGLVARAPYFANGSARDLNEVVDFFDRRFKIGLTEKNKQDVINFLSIL